MNPREVGNRACRTSVEVTELGGREERLAKRGQRGASTVIGGLPGGGEGGKKAARTDRFFACEPRRSGLALAGSHLVGFIGANAVTREDAVLSVHAGFRDHEIAAQWPQAGGPWRWQERAAGLFSHCFSARRAGVQP